MESYKDTSSSDDRQSRTKKRWNTPDLAEFGKVAETNQPRAALGSPV